MTRKPRRDENKREGESRLNIYRKGWKKQVKTERDRKSYRAEIKHSDSCFSSNNPHQLTAQKQICSSVHEEGRATGNQADGGGGQQNRLSNARRGNEFLCGSAPTMNVLQCASATCFCHRFAMLSCLNLIGWRGGREGFGQAGEVMLLRLHSHHTDITVWLLVRQVKAASVFEHVVVYVSCRFFWFPSLSTCASRLMGVQTAVSCCDNTQQLV